MTSAQTLIGGIVVTIAILIGLIFSGLVQTPPQALGESFTGTISRIDSATTTTVGPDTIVTIFSKGTDCDARMISTQGVGIKLAFGEVTGFGGAQLEATTGHYQAPSTTVIYDSGLVGCGSVSAFASASTSIMVSEF